MTNVNYRGVITTSTPTKALTYGFKRSVGRNSQGRIPLMQTGIIVRCISSCEWPSGILMAKLMSRRFIHILSIPPDGLSLEAINQP